MQTLRVGDARQYAAVAIFIPIKTFVNSKLIIQ